MKPRFSLIGGPGDDRALKCLPTRRYVKAYVSLRKKHAACERSESYGSAAGRKKTAVSKWPR